VVRRIRVLFLAAEAAPLVKIGGLGDVAGELPRALLQRGIDVRLAIPRYPELAERVRGRAPSAVVDVPRPGESTQAIVHETTLRGVPVWMIGGDPVDRVPSVYGHEAADASKFLFFVIAALQACRATHWQPEIVHAHDWHTAPALAWMRTVGKGWASCGTLLTVHNLAFMGAGGSDALQAYGIPPADQAGLPAWARLLPLPVGLAHADVITTVSPGYAAEIQTPEFGCGLEAFLASRSKSLRGILNGIDPEVWDPESDPYLVSRYSAPALARRTPNKADLQRAIGLPVEPHTPLLAMISRLDVQKGVDLLLDAAASIEGRPWQLVVLGTGDPALEDRVRAFGAEHGDHVRFLPTFDVELSRRIYAGADMIVVPSRYEPCGLVQMIGMRYGAVPIVRSTGGLRDTVKPFDAGDRGTGFVFGAAEPGALAAKILEAIGAYEDPPAWRGLQLRGMGRDCSWDRSARAYADLYRQVVARREGAP
jgi:starch synthase